MKILHLISQHPESTGSGYYLQNILRQAAKRGHENYLVAGLSGESLPDLDCIDRKFCRFVRFERDDLDFTIPGMSDVMPYPSSRFMDLSATQIETYREAFRKNLTAAAADFAPDLIHSHHLWIATGTARSLFPDIPMVTSCHSTCLRQYVQCEHLRHLVLSPCREIDGVLALSSDQREAIVRLSGIDEEKISVVGGGFNEAFFTPGTKIEPPPVELLYAGKLSCAKGVDWLLRTFNNLQDDSLHLHLAGSGSGWEEKACLALAAENRENITVHGRLSQEKLGELMSRCHIFVLPSFYEGLPLVLLEALASGCRIITTDLSGCRELLAPGDRDLVEFINLPVLKTIDSPDPKDMALLEQKLADAIRNMARNACRSPSPSAESIRGLTAPFNWEAVFSRMEVVYRKVVSS